MLKIVLRLGITICILQSIACTTKSTKGRSNIAIVPAPQESVFTGDLIALPSVTATPATFGVYQSLIDDVLITPNATLTTHHISPSNCKISIDTNLPKEAYTLDITKTHIQLTGGSEAGVRYGIMTLSQLINDQGNIPIGTIKDVPDHAYRSLMIDLSRNWHSVENLKQLIALAGFYKLNYVHLHLTDDGLFTFPSAAFPELMSPQHYSKEDLEDLNAFAKAYAITLIPEIDMPGHSSAFIRANAKRWGLEDSSQNYYTLNMGSEQVYDGIKTLLTEVAEVFPESPYIHIGGDEVYMGGFDKDSQVQAYMKSHQLTTLTDLYHHFIVRVGNEVKALGKQPIIWNGFGTDSSVKIPTDYIIMAWDMPAYTPQMMLDDGYTIINSSWQPLYVVNNRKWSPESIYKWSPTQWKTHQTLDTLPGYQVTATSNILGGSMCSWEQGQYKELNTIRKRLAAMSERLWNKSLNDANDFKSRNVTSDKKIDAILFPFKVTEIGLTNGDWDDANRYENFEFQDTLTISLQSRKKDISLHYTKDGSIPTTTDAMYKTPILLTDTGTLSIRAFKDDKPIGRTLEKKYFLAPIAVAVNGLIEALPPHSWAHHKFADSLVFSFTSKRNGIIRYTTDGKRPTNESPVYEDALVIKKTKTVQAALFDVSGVQIGKSWRQGYVKPGLEKSLTTGKLVITPNGKEELWLPHLINDGEIARRDHWNLKQDSIDWVIIDLEESYLIDRFKVYTYWDGKRHSEYTIDTSLDKITWQQVVDRITNKAIATPEGLEDHISPITARYVRLRKNGISKQENLSLVEFQAFKAH